MVWAYGFGDGGTGLAATLLGFYLFVFYTAIAGLPAWMAGLVLMLIKVWDGINDPFVGWLSDHTHSRWGPRLPWIAWSALPLGAAMAAVWWVPPGGPWQKFAIIIAIQMLAQGLYTCVNLPYSALAAELTGSTPLRTRLNAARFTGSILAGLAGLVIGALLVQRGASGYLQMGLLTGVIISVTSLICAWGLAPFARNCQRPTGHPEPLAQQLRRLARNGRFLRVLGLYLLLWCGLQLMQPVSLIYLGVVMHLPENWSTWILLPFQLSALAGLQLWSRVANRRGRVFALRWGAGLWIGACLIAMVLVPLDGAIGPLDSVANALKLTALVATILVLGLGAATAYLIPWALLPDAIDADPDRPAGLYTAWMVVTQKLGIGLAVFMLGNVLSLSGYQAKLAQLQPESALFTIRLCMGLIPAVMVVLGLLVMRRWPEHGLHTRAVEP
ncbi:MFS transporter [Cyanobium sp. Morenito 9A2]|uniref:MFS transporter n=1 Tax=Cyanobium sp. Morenito 9A2 TaxID=2823718 RepID=UPI0020CE7875|nr:MFS transporter [Cyanobium sp. Morenito 9A2]MCP9851125.1 MFS transporter [Cyanobium sp. Morenito 9A2]